MKISVQKNYNKITVSIPISDDATCVEAVKAMFEIFEACGYDKECLFDACATLSKKHFNY